MSEYRHEYKYLINNMQAQVLQAGLGALLEQDPYADETGVYVVKSLYFDDETNRCYYENENGTDPRSKFRIRYYNNDLTNIRLEKKSKLRGMTKKESCMISEEMCRAVLEGKDLFSMPALDETSKVLLTELKLRRMHPKVIVTYERRPLICPAGNVRVTFDGKLLSSNAVEFFLEKEAPQRPVLKTGNCILEVKWDELLPFYIKNMLQTGEMQWSSFSKYYLCRRYSSNGGINL